MQDVSRWLKIGSGDRNELIVVIHGFSRAGERMAAVCQTLQNNKPDADLFVPGLPYGKNRLCKDKAENVVAGIVSDIDGLVAEREREGGAYRSIVFVGHSYGAVLARKVAIVAFGEQVGHDGFSPAPFEPGLRDFRTPRAWAPNIRRIVLLAGMNQGWAVSSATDWLTTVWWSILQLFGEFVLGGRPMIFAIRKGAPFLVQTRLQWIALMDPEFGPRPKTITVQLLGTRDDQVSPDDNVDYSVDLYGAVEQSYFYIEVRNSKHGDVIEMAATDPARSLALRRKQRVLPAAVAAGLEKRRSVQESVRNERRAIFLSAVEAPREDLKKLSIPREQMADNLPPEPDPHVTDVAFVVHGIRDKGFWTQKVARTIKRKALPNQKFESWTRSYGYFALLPFMLRTVRQRKVEWLMDCYAEARARFPRARFHYFGHSNGTYLAAQALIDYPAARFEHIVFAGSVVRSDYDWRKFIQPSEGPPRVKKVLNYVATRDWVVAIFPKGVQRWKRFNLGSAGHDGFLQGSPVGPVYQVNYISGSHGAGHEEQNWEDVAEFIVGGKPPDLYHGEPPELRTPLFAERQDRLWRLLGRVSFFLFPAVVAGALIVGALIVWPFITCGYDVLRAGAVDACQLNLTAASAALRVLMFAVYGWVIYLFVTRF